MRAQYARRFVRVTAVAAILAVVACVFPVSNAAVSVVGVGTFECGQAFHGCTAWFAVRPEGWAPPDGWAPGITDIELRPTGDHHGKWVLAAVAADGRAPLEPGDYTFLIAFTEVSDIEPYVLGTDERPGTGVVSTTIACSADVTVPAQTLHVEVLANIGPACRIDVTLHPGS